MGLGDPLLGPPLMAPGVSPQCRRTLSPPTCWPRRCAALPWRWASCWHWWGWRCWWPPTDTATVRGDRQTAGGTVAEVTRPPPPAHLYPTPLFQVERSAWGRSRAGGTAQLNLFVCSLGVLCPGGAGGWILHWLVAGLRRAVPCPQGGATRVTPLLLHPRVLAQPWAQSIALAPPTGMTLDPGKEENRRRRRKRRRERRRKARSGWCGVG